jgi:hypothetical protein
VRAGGDYGRGSEKGGGCLYILTEI